jgi:hypothetical protein
VREIRTLRAMWRALETEPYGVTAPVLDATSILKQNDVSMFVDTIIDPLLVRLLARVMCANLS